METLLVATLRRDLAKRQRANPALSMRGYARVIGVHPATLCGILNGTRVPSLKKLDGLLEPLNLSPLQRNRIKEDMKILRMSSKLKAVAAGFDRASEKETVLREELHFNIISEWEHYALLSLLQVKGFKSDMSWIARRLGISVPRAEYTLGNLIRANLVESTSQGDLQRTVARLTTVSEDNSAVLRAAHKEALAIASDKIDLVPVAERGFYSETVAIDPANLGIARKAVDEFLRRMCKILETGSCSEVYHLGVQFFPLTQKKDIRGI